MIYKEKIAIAIPSLSSGGAERVASELANEFNRRGIDVTFLLLDSDTIYYCIDEKIKIHYIEYDKNKNVISRNFERVRKIRKILIDNSINTVISFITSANFLSILATMGTDVKTYVSERNDPNGYSKKIKIIRSFLYNFASGSVFQTVDAMQCFSKRIQKKSIVIGNPIKRDLPKWQNVMEHDMSIITACRLEKQKNIPMLIDAFAKVKETHKESKLIIYGKGSQYENLKTKINDLNLAESIILKGTSNVWHQEASSSSIFVLPSDHEGMSNSLLEAMAMGIPVISTDHPIGGAREVIEDGVNGFLIPVKDTNMLIEKILELISNKELQYKISNEAVKIIEKMNIEDITNKWLSYIYGDI